MAVRPPPLPVDPARVFALAGCAALARVLLAESADGLAAHGSMSLAASAASVRFLGGFVAAFVALFALRLWHRARPRAWLPVLACGGLVYVCVSLRWPAMPLEAPGFDGPKALATQGLALIVALAVTSALVRRKRLPRHLERVLVRGTLLLLAASLVLRVVERIVSRATRELPNVILVSIDGLRADRLGCAGWTRPTTPCLDAFARRAVRFENAYSPTYSTLGGHATLLTGLLPSEHQVGPQSGLPARAPALAEELRAQGLDTFALVDGTPWLDERFGLSRGFAWWRTDPGDADAKLAGLEPILDVLATRRAFVFVHFADANADTRRTPYESDPEDERACVPPYAGGWRGCDEQGNCGAQWLLAHGTGTGAPPDAEILEQVSARYDAGVRSLDRRLGLLFDDLERRGLLATSLVIVTSDHGEAFFEHGRFLHQDGFRECTHVPLFVRPPGGTDERSIEPAVSIADVAPTVLEWLGVNATRPTARSLAACVRGGPAESLPGLARIDLGPGRGGVCSARTAMLRFDGPTGLYDLLVDPWEQHPLDADGDPRTGKLAEGLRGPASPPFGPGIPLGPLDEDARRRLERLGEPDPTAGGPR